MKIPKKIFFFWNSEKLSWMRYMTLYSFTKLNPDWEVTLCVSNKNNDKKINGPETQDYLEYNGEDYYNKINDLGVIIEEVKLPSEYDKLGLNPIQESDIFRYYKLYKDGGFYSDMDILFIRPMNELYNKINESGSDTVLFQAYNHLAIGFLGSSQNNSFYGNLFKNALSVKKNTYQSHGTSYINDLYFSNFDRPTLINEINRIHPELTVYNYSKLCFYQYDWLTINQMFNNSNVGFNQFSEEAIGYHWYGGSPITQKFNNIINEFNFHEYNNTFCNLVEMCFGLDIKVNDEHKKMINKKVILENWIDENTINSDTVIELGAGFFVRLASVNHSVKNRIGIEIYKPYIDNATYHNCVKIEGDILKYKELLTDYNKDTALIVDVLEHFDMDTGYKLINDLKSDFNKILLMLPVGKYVQEKDVTGHGGHEYQKHRSYWYESDIEKLGFKENIIDLNFHSPHHHGDIINKDTGCYFGVWSKTK